MKGPKSLGDNFGEFIHQLQPESKTLIRKLERIIMKSTKHDKIVTLLFNHIYNEKKKKPKIFFFSFSGFLTGKFKRDEMPKPETRIGFTALAEQNRALQSHPAWSVLKEQDTVWELLDAMKEIANVHGNIILFFFFFFFPL